MASETLRGAQQSVTRPVHGDRGAGAPDRAPPTPEELASVRDTVVRVSAAYPLVERATVEAAVRAAYDSFREARVRVYVPILAERRSRKALATAFPTGSTRTDAEAEG
ncbi:three-helix bundle dimerization domain-containing protein [Streptomyces sp. NPDC097617]|uniref:three-helix bundle dimerization domain-containing protein n=1 Tax=Streptomyces sp. NPDC097617 TaxID=3366091 RepID=UPI00382F0F45